MSKFKFMNQYTGSEKKRNRQKHFGNNVHNGFYNQNDAWGREKVKDDAKISSLSLIAIPFSTKENKACIKVMYRYESLLLDCDMFDKYTNSSLYSL